MHTFSIFVDEDYHLFVCNVFAQELQGGHNGQIL